MLVKANTYRPIEGIRPISRVSSSHTCKRRSQSGFSRTEEDLFYKVPPHRIKYLLYATPEICNIFLCYSHITYEEYGPCSEMGTENPGTKLCCHQVCTNHEEHNKLKQVFFRSPEFLPTVACLYNFSATQTRNYYSQMFKSCNATKAN